MTASFVFQHLAHAMLDRVLQHEVDGAHDVRLADTVDAADALFDPHRVPRHVEVDDDVAELQVQALAAGVGRDQDCARRARTPAAPWRALPDPCCRSAVATEKPRLSRKSASIACVGTNSVKISTFSSGSFSSCCSL